MSFTLARVIAQHRGLLRIKIEESGEEYWAELSGKLRREGEPSVVGDYVKVLVTGQANRLRIEECVPRKNLFQRIAAGTTGETQAIAANIDGFFIVTSVNEDFSLRRIERYRAMANQAGVSSFLILSKSDLLSQEKRVMLEWDLPSDLPWIWMSSKTGEGFEELERRFEVQKTYLMMGSSGVGKSSLINRLLNVERQTIGDIREGDDKGRHTTTSRSLFELPNGAFLIDTPGIRELQLSADGEAIAEVFGDIESLALECRFRDCSHESEPGCRVLEAIEKGELDAGRLKNLRKLMREQEKLRQKPHEKARAKQKLKAMSQGLKTIYKERGK